MNRFLSIASDPETFLVSEEEAGGRIDRLLADRYPQYSRTYFQTLLEQGCIFLNGQLVKKRELPETGDEIEVYFQDAPEHPAEPESIPLHILYEDEHLLAVNKPAGMVVHPAPGHRSGTFVNALLAHCEQLAVLDPLRPGIVHRLDKDTSGVLLAAKTLQTHQKLIAQFAGREMEKTYLAISVGKPKICGVLSAPLERHPVRRKEMAVLPDGKEAISDIRILAYNHQLSLLLIRPKTGRTHQIRVHLKHVGSPVLGDEVYGHSRINQALGVSRQLLHAYRLEFTHPITGEPISLCAPLPEDMQSQIRQFATVALNNPLVKFSSNR